MQKKILHAHVDALVHGAEVVRCELVSVDTVSCRTEAAMVLQVVNAIAARYALVCELVLPYPLASAYLMERNDQVQMYLLSLRQTLDKIRTSTATTADLDEIRSLSSLLETLFTEIKILLEANFL